MVTVKFHGDLKRFADTPIALEVSSFRELMSGLLTQIQGLSQRLRQGYYKVRIGSRYLSEAQIKAEAIVFDDESVIHFTPVAIGAGKNMNIANIVIGVVLIAASWYAGGAAGWGYLGAQAGATMAFTVGASMVLSGVVGLLTKPPSMDTKFNDSEKQQSTSFSNIRNLTPQGRPIPLLYGKMLTSLVLISQGLDTFDEVSDAEKAKRDAEHNTHNGNRTISGRTNRQTSSLDVDKPGQDSRERREREEQERREERERNSRLADDLF